MTLKTCAFCCVLLVVAIASGCGRKTGPERYDVRGAVTFRGEPVPSGTITFEPDLSQSNSGPASVIPIMNGTYDSQSLERPGPLAGPLIVRISGYPAADPQIEIQPALFPEYRTKVDLATSATATVLDFTVPERARKRGDAKP